jgi:hypothetical protein
LIWIRCLDRSTTFECFSEARHGGGAGEVVGWGSGWREWRGCFITVERKRNDSAEKLLFLVVAGKQDLLTC